MLKSADRHETILTPVICHKHVRYHDSVTVYFSMRFSIGHPKEDEKWTFFDKLAGLRPQNEAPDLKQAAIVTMATRVLQPLKRAFLCIPPECLTACKI